ncbi:MAG: PAS domain S-box protein [Coriobacteriia bacterium]
MRPFNRISAYVARLLTQKHRWVGLVGVAVVYFTTMRLFVGSAAAEGHEMSLWIPSGIAVAAVLHAGRRMLPVIGVVAFLAMLTVVPVGFALAIAIAAVAEAWLLRLIFMALTRGRADLETSYRVLAFGVATIVATAVPALAGVTALGAEGVPAPVLPFAGLSWWLADASGVLVAAPVIVLLAERSRRYPALRVIEGLVAVALSIGVAVALYSAHIPHPYVDALPFALLPLFTWVAFRCERRAMALTTLVVSLITVWGTVRGFGPFASDSVQQSLIAVQLVLSVVAFSSLLLATLVSERRRAAEELAESHALLEARVAERTEELAAREAWFRLLYERAPLSYVSLDGDGRVLDVNQAGLAMLGYQRASVLGVGFSELIAEGQRASFLGRLGEMREAGSVHGVDFDVRRADGSTLTLTADGSVETAPDGSIHRMHWILKDVTEKRRIERALIASQQHYESLFENTHSVMILLDPVTTQVLDVNQAAVEYYGYARSGLVGRPLADINGSGVQEMVGRLLQSAHTGGGVHRDRHRLASGEWRDVEVHSGPVLIEGRQRIFGIVHDITERVAAESELARHREHLAEMVDERTRELSLAYQELEEANRAKDAFLANMSHELRTPLNSVIGFTDLLLAGLTGDLNDEQTKQIAMVNSSGRHLLDLVDDVLDITRISSGHMTTSEVPFSLRDIVSGAVDSVRPSASKKGLSVSVEIADAVPHVMYGDERKVRQVLLNLLGNAVKFTDSGEIVVTVAAGDDDVHVEVRDTGLGIPANEIERIFDEFHQVTPDREAKPGGVGLGLAISRRLARMLGGDVVAVSTPGAGSTFTLMLPHAAKAALA